MVMVQFQNIPYLMQHLGFHGNCEGPSLPGRILSHQPSQLLALQII